MLGKGMLLHHTALWKQNCLQILHLASVMCSDLSVIYQAVQFSYKPV